MHFIARDFWPFLLIVLTVHWLLPSRTARSLWLLLASYSFYGWIHPWWCILLAASTTLDYTCGLLLHYRPRHRHLWLACSLLGNLGTLAAFKYFDFFAHNLQTLLHHLGLPLDLPLLHVMLPAGISFYTLQSLSYTLDIHAGRLRPRRNPLDVAVFVSLFPQLVAGPIERARHLLPQIEADRPWNTPRFLSALPLLIRGLVKKMVVANHIAPLVDDIFRLAHPGTGLLFVGGVAFAVQIYADFSGYTDIARAAARMLGFELMENFRAPYLAVSPSDFWRRWHISLSLWIRDYLYIPLGGSRGGGAGRLFFVLIVTLGLSGLWHGAAWHFVAWGLYHGLLVWVYHRIGCGGGWVPRTRLRHVGAWALMCGWTLVGWLMFRAPSLGWLWRAVWEADPAPHAQAGAVMWLVLAEVVLHTLPLGLLAGLDALERRAGWVRGLGYGVMLALLVVWGRGEQEPFLYFQF